MNISDKIGNAGVMAVLVIDKLGHTLPLVESLIKGGVTAIELTLRTAAAIDAAKMIKKSFPEILLGLGTVLTTEQVKIAVDLGADFAVAPGCNPKVIAEANAKGLFFGPGVMTPTDIEMAIQEGCKVLKYFPAETSGGLKHLESMVGPYQHLGLKFIPLGGCTLENAGSYLASSLVCAIGGSWIAPQKLIQAENWDAINENARQITNLITSLRQGITKDQ